MKVLLVNGSGHAKGCTYTALEEVAGALEKNGIETEIIQVGTIVSSDKDLLQLISDDVDVKLLKQKDYIRMNKEVFFITF